MIRPMPITIAAILTFAINAISFVMALPILAAGREGLPPQPGMENIGGPPFWAGILFITLAIAGLFGAYGLWNNQKWGKVVSIVTCVVQGLFGLGDVLGALSVGNYVLAAGFALLVLACAAVVFLVLRREPRPAMA
ncbi:MAG: hypothetical protein U0822_19045 [Anaerolineae bacterium]